jgi:stage V sporulation protein G
MGNFTINNINKETGEVISSLDCEVRAFPIAEPKGKTKGYASVTVGGLFGAHNLSIVEGTNGLFVAMPQTRDARGDYRDIFHPVTAEGRQALQDAVLNEFAASLNAMVEQKESTVQKLRDAAAAAKGKAAPDTGKEPKEKGKKKIRAGALTLRFLFKGT